MKFCRLCKLPKSLDEFGNNSRSNDGKHWACRPCWNTYVQEKRWAKGVKPMESFLARLWGTIQQCGHEEMCPYCCWPWQKALDDDGYGHISISFNGKTRPWPAPRIVYEVWHGVLLPDNICTCHYCDFAACCNPMHLWPGTRADNRLDCVDKGRQAKGMQTGYYTHPEVRPRGERNGSAKLT